MHFNFYAISLRSRCSRCCCCRNCVNLKKKKKKKPKCPWKEWLDGRYNHHIDIHIHIYIYYNTYRYALKLGGMKTKTKKIICMKTWEWRLRLLFSLLSFFSTFLFWFWLTRLSACNACITHLLICILFVLLLLIGKCFYRFIIIKRHRYVPARLMHYIFSTFYFFRLTHTHTHSACVYCTHDINNCAFSFEPIE